MRREVGVLTVLALLLGGSAPAVKADLPGPTTMTADVSGPMKCEKFHTQVGLQEVSSEDQTVVSWLCWRGSLHRRPTPTVQVVLSGGTYGHVYWDPKGDPQPPIHSYVEAMTEAGYAVLNIDRIGIGESDHPDAHQVTLPTNAHVVHQLVDKLRKGELGGTLFNRVLLVGHSHGSLYAILEAADHGDVDGLVLTGFRGGAGPGIAFVGAALEPAQLESRFLDRPPGYLTTRRGERKVFYYEPDADGMAIDYDEGTKETLTTGELNLADIVLTLGKSSCGRP